MTTDAPFLFRYDHDASQDLNLFGLRDALKRELEAIGPDQPRHLLALVELGGLDEGVRQTFLDGHSSGARSHTLFYDEEFAELVPYGPSIISHEDGPQALLDDLKKYDGDTVSAWIISALPAAELARYLGNFTLARQTAKDRHVLRYYAPEVLPRLREIANRRWWQTLFKPVVQWWYPFATTQTQNWRVIKGEGKQPEAKFFHLRRWLTLTEELWEALVSDPLPYKLTDTLQQQAPELFESDCYGVRVAQVGELLNEARQNGLTDQTDYLTYVWYALADRTLVQGTRWRNAVCRAAAGEAPLNKLYMDTPL
jgi:hypothetical protein